MDIRFITTEDKPFWYSIDKHLPEKEFYIKKSETIKDTSLLLTISLLDCCAIICFGIIRLFAR